jgi:hypothetical protein
MRAAPLCPKQRQRELERNAWQRLLRANLFK